MNHPFISNSGGYIATNNNILIEQRKYVYTGCCSSLSSEFITYNYTPPTPILEERGLTPLVLQKEILSIEAKANKTARDNSQCTNRLRICALISFIILVCGGSLFALYPSKHKMALLIVGACLSFIGLMGLIILCNSTRYKKLMARDLALDTLRYYVEIVLNEKYQKRNGIRWSIVESETAYVNARTGQQVSASIPYYNIGISCVATSAMNNVINNTMVVLVQDDHEMNEMESVDDNIEQATNK